MLIVSLLGFYVWSQQTYQASEFLHQHVEAIPRVNDWVVFEPEEQSIEGIILYPGAKVEPEAYSYLALKLSDQGYLVVIPEVRLNFAILDINKANEIIEEYPAIENWYLGGHSLGGVAAASYTFEHLNQIAGLFFLASYPTNDFSALDLPMLSIYAELDGLSTPEKVLEREALLSEQAQFNQISGGNHAQFGLYGPQKGDNDATITAQEQQDQIIDQLLSWFKDSSIN